MRALEGIGLRRERHAHRVEVRDAERREARERGVWLHAISGRIDVAGEALGPGDGVAIENADPIAIEARAAAEFLLFDLA